MSSANRNTFITFEECCIINLHWAPWGLFPSTVRYNIELGDRLSIDYLNSYNRAAWEIFIFAQTSIEVLSVTIRVPGTHSFVTKPRPGNLSAQLRLKDCHTSFQKGICHSFRSLGLSPLILSLYRDRELGDRQVIVHSNFNELGCVGNLHVRHFQARIEVHLTWSLL